MVLRLLLLNNELKPILKVYLSKPCSRVVPGEVLESVLLCNQRPMSSNMHRQILLPVLELLKSRISEKTIEGLGRKLDLKPFTIRLGMDVSIETSMI